MSDNGNPQVVPETEADTTPGEIDQVEYLTSTSALELEEVPAELIVVGANAIGLEIGQLYTHLGSEVTFVEALDRVAPFEEPEISDLIAPHLPPRDSKRTSACLAAVRLDKRLAKRES